jgi:hypothetical protein
MTSPIYQPLDPGQIRVLSVFPGKGGSMIECELHLVTINKLYGRHEFDALSYEWGKPDGPKKEIKVEDQIVSIGENLWHALDCLRWVLWPRRVSLWIDALCINQHDPLEKSHQVVMMGEIYKTASTVRVWLGGSALKRKNIRKEEHNTVRAFERLGRMWDPRHIGIQRPQQFIKWLPTTSRGVWKTVDDLLRRSYWSRIRIVQEYILGRQVVIHWGFCTIEGTIFNNALALLADFDPQQHPQISNSLGLEYYTPRINNSPVAKISARHCEGRNQTLAELLEACRLSKATLPQDKIYAILGLATDVPMGWIPLDYGKSLWRVKVDVGRFFTYAEYFPQETQSHTYVLSFRQNFSRLRGARRLGAVQREMENQMLIGIIISVLQGRSILSTIVAIRLYLH